MDLRFHPHAVERMQERKLTVSEVQLILSFPDGRIRQTKDKVIFYKELDHRHDNFVAAVVIESLSKELHEVITVLVNFEVRK